MQVLRVNLLGWASVGNYCDFPSFIIMNCAATCLWLCKYFDSSKVVGMNQCFSRYWTSGWKTKMVAVCDLWWHVLSVAFVRTWLPSWGIAAPNATNSLIFNMALSLIRSLRASFDSCATFAARLNQCEDCKKEAISVSSLLKTKALKRIMFWQSSTLSAAHRETCPCVSIWTNTMASCAPSTTQDHTYSTISYGATLA